MVSNKHENNEERPEYLFTDNEGDALPCTYYALDFLYSIRNLRAANSIGRPLHLYCENTNSEMFMMFQRLHVDVNRILEMVEQGLLQAHQEGICNCRNIIFLWEIVYPLVAKMMEMDSYFLAGGDDDDNE